MSRYPHPARRGRFHAQQHEDLTKQVSSVLLSPMTQRANDAQTTSIRPIRRGWLAFIGFLLMFTGPIVYMVTQDDPYVRSTGWPAFVIMGIGAVLGTMAFTSDRRKWVTALGGLNVVLLAIFVYMFYVWAQLPPTQGFTALKHAPGFTLANQDNVDVSLNDKLAKGPVLLVFYRGFW